MGQMDSATVPCPIDVIQIDPAHFLRVQIAYLNQLLAVVKWDVKLTAIRQFLIDRGQRSGPGTQQAIPVEPFEPATIRPTGRGDIAIQSSAHVVAFGTQPALLNKLQISDICQLLRVVGAFISSFSGGYGSQGFRVRSLALLFGTLSLLFSDLLGGPGGLGLSLGGDHGSLFAAQGFLGDGSSIERMPGKQS